MDKDYTTILLEEIRDQNKAILEGQKDQATRADIHRLEERLGSLERDVKTITVAVAVTNSDLTEHKHMPADVAHGSGHVQQSHWAAA
jgi:hypothetical protein